MNTRKNQFIFIKSKWIQIVVNKQIMRVVNLRINLDSKDLIQYGYTLL